LLKANLAFFCRVKSNFNQNSQMLLEKISFGAFGLKGFKNLTWEGAVE
jgi:hypothetical protein